ncbi:hypothetical protein [Noviherbaspirillum aerium]|uniref:hypothetical protein n=1 Tax=Noviherbaspirillum aerium TaxID=2588497 RepID=UPI00178C1C0E|nr:hypothetical protein [Noviherbaspirillum aerium]
MAMGLHQSSGTTSQEAFKPRRLPLRGQPAIKKATMAAARWMKDKPAFTFCHLLPASASGGLWFFRVKPIKNCYELQ